MTTLDKLCAGRHISPAELACHDEEHTPYPVEFVNCGRAAKLIHVFEGIRFACGGRPIPIACGYRTEAWNEHVGGKQFSQHRAGRALDLHTPEGLKTTEFWHICRTAARYDSRIGGLGLYSWGVHVDVRPRKTKIVTLPNDQFAFWRD